MKTIRHNTGKNGQKRPFEKQKGNANFQGKDTPIRLNKYIAYTGLCSRRDADELIKTGKISVNGKIVTEMGIKVDLNDIVKYKGEKLRKESKVYILLNKPRDYITTMDDPKNRKTVNDLVRKACPERVYPVGRLDRNTTGVLLLTNDGELTKVLSHPRYNKKKIYHVFLDKDLTGNDMDKIVEGITLDDGLVHVDAITYPTIDDKKQVGLEIHSGRNRIVRRLFEHLGYKIEKLDRVYFAGLTKKNLSRGKWRFLLQKEISMLKIGAYK
jgi:23S rRNA pseudouridine2605 synthase